MRVLCLQLKNKHFSSALFRILFSRQKFLRSGAHWHYPTSATSDVRGTTLLGGTHFMRQHFWLPTPRTLSSEGLCCAEPTVTEGSVCFHTGAPTPLQNAASQPSNHSLSHHTPSAVLPATLQTAGAGGGGVSVVESESKTL